MSKKVRRLYEQFQPGHYDLSLNLDREAMTFTGTVIVRGKKVGRPSQRITFHQKELQVIDAKIVKHDKKGDKDIPISRINNQNSLDEVRLHADEMVYPGDYTVTLNFKGDITRPMNGIYPCFFKHDGQDKKLIATQFESHHAREAFPCIDEPEAKATFDLTLITPAGETVLANTPVKTQKEFASKDGGRSAGTTKTGSATPLYQITTFETTPKMSSYLLAFVFGEMHSVSGKTKDGVEVRSWATVAQPKAHLTYANSEAVKILEFFNDYFQTPFPLKKVDQVALPDFESLAMENWGLITYREVGLLADPVNRSLSGEQLITLVVAHELSHQWFGNLVTMKWWDDLWLNESFASIMENIAPDALHPDWHQWEDFAVSRVLSASQRDVTRGVQPVSVDVNHPDEIMTLFDPAIVYAKGARLLTMLREYIGEDAFRAGLKNYFKKHAYNNTFRDDLWQEFSEVTGQDIAKVMTPWIKQSGQPLVTVIRQGDKLRLKQQRFLLDGTDNESLWPIPLLADTEIRQELMTNRELSITYEDKANPILNVDGNGHYIVDYGDEDARQDLKTKIVTRSVSPSGRINILNNMLLLNRAGARPLTELLDLVKGCGEEPRASVWSMLARVTSQAQLLTDGDEIGEENLREYKRQLASHWYAKLGWEDQSDDDPNTKHLRTTVLALSVGGERPDAIEHALGAFKKAGNVEKLPAEQRSLIAGAAVRFGEPEYIKQLLEEYEASPNPDVQESIAAALCSTRQSSVAERIIKWGLVKDGAVRPQDVAHWFAYLMRNYRTREAAWQWLTTNWQEMAALFGGGKHMDYFIWYAAGPLSTADWEKRFKQFFEPMLQEPASKRNIQISFNEIAARVAWRHHNESDVKAWLTKLS